MKGHGIDPILLDAADPNQHEKRNRLFEISGIRGNYPQVFVEGRDGEVFLGNYEAIESMNDMGTLMATIASCAQAEAGKLKTASANASSSRAISRQNSRGKTPPRKKKAKSKSPTRPKQQAVSKSAAPKIASDEAPKTLPQTTKQEETKAVSRDLGDAVDEGVEESKARSFVPVQEDDSGNASGFTSMAAIGVGAAVVSIAVGVYLKFG